MVVVSAEPETVLSLADRIMVHEAAAWSSREFAGRDGQQGPAAGRGMRETRWRPVSTDDGAGGGAGAAQLAVPALADAQHRAVR